LHGVVADGVPQMVTIDVAIDRVWAQSGSYGPTSTRCSNSRLSCTFWSRFLVHGGILATRVVHVNAEVSFHVRSSPRQVGLGITRYPPWPNRQVSTAVGRDGLAG
jgi:hypothetical protein